MQASRLWLAYAMRNLLLLGLLPLAGCALFDYGSVEELVGDAVAETCDRVDADVRQDFINGVNHYAAPNTVTVICAADGAILVAE